MSRYVLITQGFCVSEIFGTEDTSQFMAEFGTSSRDMDTNEGEINMKRLWDDLSGLPIQSLEGEPRSASSAVDRTEAARQSPLPKSQASLFGLIRAQMLLTSD